jgi:hypothetical protein
MNFDFLRDHQNSSFRDQPKGGIYGAIVAGERELGSFSATMILNANY